MNPNTPPYTTRKLACATRPVRCAVAQVAAAMERGGINQWPREDRLAGGWR